MSVQKIDRDKLRAAIRNLRNESVYFMLVQAIDMLPPTKLHPGVHFRAIARRQSF